MKIKKSVVVAFLELLKAVDNGEEVFLLRSSDAASHILVKDYIDIIRCEKMA